MGFQICCFAWNRVHFLTANTKSKTIDEKQVVAQKCRIRLRPSSAPCIAGVTF